MEELTRIIDIAKTNPTMRWVVNAMVKIHRSNVESIVRIFAREIVRISRSHDNSLTSKDEQNLAKHSANQLSDISNYTYTKELENHYKENSHHPQHYNEFTEMNLIDIVEYTADLIANSSYDKIELPSHGGTIIPKETLDAIITHINESITKRMVTDKVPDNMQAIIKNTVSALVTDNPVPFYDMMRRADNDEQKEKTE